MVCQLSQGETKESGLFRKQSAHISENCSLESALLRILDEKQFKSHPLNL